MAYNKSSSQAGFALLMTLLIVSIIIPVTLTILDVSMKQVRLTGTSRDSEGAFAAANAGAECAQYLRREHDTDFEDAVQEDISSNCRGLDVDIDEQTQLSVGSVPPYINHFSYSVSWGTGLEARCALVTTVILVADDFDDLVPSVAAIRQAIPSFPDFPTGAPYQCREGGRCTLTSVRGHNRACPASGTAFPLGTTQREVLLQY